VPKLDVIDGIAAVRTTFPEIWMDEEENVTLLLAMKTYHRKYDPDLKRYSDEPVHDWSSDWCDMLRYLCIMANKKVRAKIESKNRSKGVPQSLNEIVERARGGVNYAFCLDDLWGLKENHG
jgi:hypothetical protein